MTWGSADYRFSQSVIWRTVIVNKQNDKEYSSGTNVVQFSTNINVNAVQDISHIINTEIQT
jgi:hypothetical protein